MDLISPTVATLSEKNLDAILDLIGVDRDSKSSLGNWNKRRILSELNVAHSLGVFQQGQLLAFVFYRHLPPRTLEVSLLATHPQWRRQGLMRGLFSEVLAQHSDVREVWLEAHAENTGAQALYSALGFSQVGTRPGYYADGGNAYLYSYLSLP